MEDAELEKAAGKQIVVATFTGLAAEHVAPELVTPEDAGIDGNADRDGYIGRIRGDYKWQKGQCHSDRTRDDSDGSAAKQIKSLRSQGNNHGGAEMAETTGMVDIERNERHGREMRLCSAREEKLQVFVTGSDTERC